MKNLNRLDNSILGQWYWSVDRSLIFGIILLAIIGLLTAFSSSTAVASTFGVADFDFAIKHMSYLLLAMFVLFVTSILSVRRLVMIALILALVALVMLFLVPYVGREVNGAKRWISLFGLSIQPSELFKPCFALLSAWFLAREKAFTQMPGTLVVLLLYLVGIFFLVNQPDIGQSALLTSILFVQLVVAGISIYWIISFFVTCTGLGLFGYLNLPHVQARIDKFLFPQDNDNYQVLQSLRSFENGGLFGQGIGEGQIKSVLPDAHADFAFAVLGEEYGLILCFIVLLLIGFIVIRAIMAAIRSENLFVMLCVSGITAQFGTQAFINMASSVHLIPTKGMTLPFISYGGSSMLTLAFGLGIMLAVLRNGQGDHFHYYTDEE